MNIEFLIQFFNLQPQSPMMVMDPLQHKIRVIAAVNMTQSSNNFSQYVYIILFLCDKSVCSLPRSAN